jgi:RNA polymerase sigma-70 factor (ECF subfamily)
MRRPPQRDITDAELLLRSRRDPDAFRALYDRHAQSIHGFLLRRTGDPVAALELTAETFAEAWLVRDRFRDEAGGSAAPWLFGIARNVVLQSVRRRSIERRAIVRLGMSGEVAAHEDPVDERWLDGLDPDMEEALDELSIADRKALEFRVMQERPYDEVAALMHSSPGAARVRVSRVLAQLRGRLQTTTDGSNR